PSRRKLGLRKMQLGGCILWVMALDLQPGGCIMASTTTEHETSDRIEKKALLKASRARVWRALADAGEFGTWFGVRLEGAFSEGAKLRGKITIKGYDHLTLEMLVERIEPEHYLSYRWHPYAVDPKVDYSSEPTTLVEFRLDEAEGGTLLT